MKEVTVSKFGQQFDDVMIDVTTKHEPYTVQVVNTIGQNKRHPGPYIPVAVVLCYHQYEQLLKDRSDANKRVLELEEEIDNLIQGLRSKDAKIEVLEGELDDLRLHKAATEPTYPGDGPEDCG